MILRSILIWIFSCIFIITSHAETKSLPSQASSNQFPSEGFEDRINFWKLIFSEYGEKQVVLHDLNNFRLIYDVIQFDHQPRHSRSIAKKQRRIIKAKIRQLVSTMNSLRSRNKNFKDLNNKQEKLLTAVRAGGLDPSPALFKKLRHNIHAQRGVKERFRKGIMRSGLYLKEIEQIFEQYGLPQKLALLPHVESSFNYQSRSHKGAAGIWQFMPRTGRAYNLKITRSIDQRRDPIASTKAAARYLKDSYRVLGNWPLAITSYNHGRGGMARAKRRHGPNLLTIISKYKSRSFRYASKNFYVEFLAAVEVSKNYQTYFGDLAIAEPFTYDEFNLKKRIYLKDLTEIGGLSEKLLRKYNPQFRNYLFRRSRILPVGLKIKVPKTIAKEVHTAILTARSPAIPKDKPGYYRVKWGDSLSTIAKKMGTSLNSLRRTNGLRGSRIYADELLKIPGWKPESRKATSPPKMAIASKNISNQPVARKHPNQRYRVQPGDSLSSIAKKLNTSVNNIKRLNGLKSSRIYPKQVLLVSIEAPINRQHYKVRRGDNLSKIARRFQTSVEKIKLKNNIKNLDQLHPGQILIIH